MPPTKILKSAEKNDFQPLNLLKHRRAVCRGPFDEQFYQYFYSENYQPIDKLVSSSNFLENNHPSRAKRVCI